MEELLLFSGALWSRIVILRHPADLLAWKPEQRKGKRKLKEINRHKWPLLKRKCMSQMYLSMTCPGVVRINITLLPWKSASLIIEFNGWWLRRMLHAFEKSYSNNLTFPFLYDLSGLRERGKNKRLHFVTPGKVINLIVQSSRGTIRELEFSEGKHSRYLKCYIYKLYESPAFLIWWVNCFDTFEIMLSFLFYLYWHGDISPKL